MINLHSVGTYVQVLVLNFEKLLTQVLPRTTKSSLQSHVPDLHSAFSSRQTGLAVQLLSRVTILTEMGKQWYGNRSYENTYCQ